MTHETPKTPRRPSPYLASDDTERVEFTLKALPPDLSRERKGRPARSPSLPPDESATGEQATG